ncbi:MAG: hypothetical protein M1830_003306, partial [Pleopsidium flavum]
MFGDFPFKDKIVVVTGGGSGINLAFTKLAASHGAKCVIADLRLTQEAEEYMKSAKGVIFARCDVAKWADLQNLITVSQKEFGDVPDIYVAGAGVFEPKWSNFWDDTETERYAEVDININHPIKLTRIAIRALLGKNKKGVVLIIASLAGLVGIYSSALYSATKHAIVGFVKSMADADPLEGVKVVCICPGIVKTPLWTDRPEKMAQWSVSDVKSMTSEDIAESMLDLIENGKYGGGTVLKHDTDTKEAVKFENAIMPSAGGDQMAAFKERLDQPIREMMKGERGVAS